LPLFGYAAIALLLIGTLMLMPRSPSSRSRGYRDRARRRPRLAIAQLEGTPGQVSVSLAGDRCEREPHGVDGHHGRVVP
jgi:putative ABC transport system permease protein